MKIRTAPKSSRQKTPMGRREIAELTQAMTSGQGNRAERRRKQAELKKLMRRKP